MNNLKKSEFNSLINMSNNFSDLFNCNTSFSVSYKKVKTQKKVKTIVTFSFLNFFSCTQDIISQKDAISQILGTNIWNIHFDNSCIHNINVIYTL